MNAYILLYYDVFVSDQAHVVKSLFGKTVWTRFAEPAHGSGRDQRLRRSGSPVFVAHVRHGSGGGAGFRCVVWVFDDRRVSVPGHARAGGDRRNRAEGPDRRLHGPKTAALEIRCRGEPCHQSQGWTENLTSRVQNDLGLLVFR